MHARTILMRIGSDWLNSSNIWRMTVGIFILVGGLNYSGTVISAKLTKLNIICLLMGRNRKIDQKSKFWSPENPNCPWKSRCGREISRYFLDLTRFFSRCLPKLLFFLAHWLNFLLTNLPFLFSFMSDRVSPCFVLAARPSHTCRRSPTVFIYPVLCKSGFV